MYFSLNRKSAIENRKLPDDLIRSFQHLLRNRQADLLGGFEIDEELKLCRLLDGNVGGFGAFQNPVDKVSGAPE